jgi:non-specific serine/threonine protein kinase
MYRGSVVPSDTTRVDTAASAPSLPFELTTFVGREREQAEVARLIDTTRLLTLVGSGGVGKTRLALAVAGVLADDYVDGVWLVELASLADPALVAQAVITTLGVDLAGQSPDDTLVGFLRARQLLLILDNCEHLQDACARLAEHLLRRCPELRILATSRTTLGVAGETAWRVPSLMVPDPRSGTGTDEIAACEAVRLFCIRARSALPSFVLGDTNATVVADICRRLDGIPLAIELAAARVRLLGPVQILERLDDRFSLLVGGSTTGPTRQQTLRATLDWSYALLSETERLLLQRLSVFAGSWTLEAAQTIWSDGGRDRPDVLEVLSGLVDQSLVLVEGQEVQARYELLETVRQYALERLHQSNTENSVRARLADYYVALAEQAELGLIGHEQASWLNRLEREHDNLRGVLGWGGGTAAELGLRLSGSLVRFWDMRGYLREGRAWLEGFLAVEPTRTAMRAKALQALGELSVRQGDNAPAHACFEDSAGLYAEIGDAHGRAVALGWLGFTIALEGDYPRGGGLLDESVALLRNLGDLHGAGWALGRRGMLARTEGDFARAKRLLEDALELQRPTGGDEGIAFVLNNLGQLARIDGEYRSAERLLEQSLVIFRALDAKAQVGWTLGCLGNVARLQGKLDRAQQLLDESVGVLNAIGCERHAAQGLSFAGVLAVQQGHFVRGVRLIGAGANYAPLRASLDVDELRDWDQSLAIARGRLGEEAYGTAWADGQVMHLTQAVAYALSTERPSSAVLPHSSPSAWPLSPREREVAVLIARGHSNREIAEQLVIGERTAEAHVTHVLTKLGLRSRAQVAVWVLEHGGSTGSG